MFWTLVFGLFVITVKQSFACSCLQMHIQNAFCHADIIIKGKATSMAIHPGSEEEMELVSWRERTKTYNVTVEEVFKAPANSGIAAGGVIRAVTNAEGSLCGGHLYLNEDLLITGALYDGKMLGFGLCSYTSRFSDLSSFQISGLNGLYTCECQVFPWFHSGGDTCRIYIGRSRSRNCIHKYGRCGKSDDGVCAWHFERDQDC